MHGLAFLGLRSDEHYYPVAIGKKTIFFLRPTQLFLLANDKGTFVHQISTLGRIKSCLLPNPWPESILFKNEVPFQELLHVHQKPGKLDAVRLKGEDLSILSLW
jgi:hypothetical protein